MGAKRSRVETTKTSNRRSRSSSGNRIESQRPCTQRQPPASRRRSSPPRVAPRSSTLNSRKTNRTDPSCQAEGSSIGKDHHIHHFLRGAVGPEGDGNFWSFAFCPRH